MLDKIKSAFNLKNFFSYIYEGAKLNIIKYNKNIQQRLDISILNYKIYSGKFKVEEKDGIVKEYDGYNDSLIFKGEYLNGKRNGKGKEYNDYGNLKFDGEYLNGKRNGKGKEYKWEGTLIFEGEYVNGERNGKGKEYNWEGTLIFEGEYVNGEKNGKGKK